MLRKLHSAAVNAAPHPTIHGTGSHIKLPSSHIFESALQDYEKQTGTKLVDHPLARQLDTCESVDSVIIFLQQQVRTCNEFRGDNGKVIKSLKCAVHVLYMLSASAALGEGTGLPFPPAKAIFAGFAVLLATVKDVSASYDSLVDLLASIESFLKRLYIYTKIPPTVIMTEIIVKIIVELLSTLAVATKQIKQGRPKKFVKKLLGENDVEAILLKLDRLTLDEARTTAAQSLEAVYGLVQHLRQVIDDGQALADDIRDALEIMNLLRRDKLQRDIRKWLSPPDPWKNHNIARESRHNGTATWFTQGNVFAEWKSSGLGSVLWIHGKPGAGKSVLCSAIIQDIRDMHKAGLASLAFFYCDFRDNQKKDRHGLLASLLVQLCDQSNSYCAVLSDFYSVHDSGSQHPSDDDLAQCLETLLKLPGQVPVYIILDALDECSNTTGLPSPRDKVLELVQKLVTLRLPGLRICVTSRPEADITPVLDCLASHSISLHGESGQRQDMAEYVKFVVNTDPMMRRWKPADKELVIDVLTKRADGMFRWIFCQVVYLRRCIPGRIRRALDELPETLDETYARSLEEIDDQSWEYAHRLFQCVAVAPCPLRVEELAEFLAFDFNTGQIPLLLPNWRPEDPVGAVLSTCPSLFTVFDVDGDKIIQFSHFSVKEYLTSPRLVDSRDTISRFHVSMLPANAMVAKACLSVLLHVDETINRRSLQNFPLAEYAAEYLVDHARFEGVWPSIQDGMKQLFDSRRRHFPIWVWIYDPEDHWYGDDRSENPFPPKGTPLHYAAFYGLLDVVKLLVIERPQDVNALGFDYDGTPLFGASRNGHLEVARVLLENGADVKARDNKHRAPLHWASKRGRVEVVRILLEHGADAKVQDDRGRSPLHRASQHGHVEIARILLESDADPLAHDKKGRTSLHWASKRGHIAAARILLSHGADVEAQDINNRTPLDRALERGHLDVAQVLFEHGADTNTLEEKSQVPLHLTSRVGYHDLVWFLHQRRSKTNVRDEVRAPFQEASAEEHHSIMQLLFEDEIQTKEML